MGAHDDGLPEPSRELPVPPGEGPFHVRGFIYRRLMEHVVQQGMMDALVPKLTDDVRAFATQRFNLTTWYDAFPVMPISIAVAELENVPYAKRLLDRSHAAAMEMIPRLFRALLSVSAPQSVALRLATFVPQQYDFVTLSNVRTDAKAGRGTLAGVPAFVAPYIFNVSVGFYRGALELARATSIEVTIENVRPSEDVKGFRALSADLVSKWS